MRKGVNDMLNELLTQSVFTKTKPEDTIDVVFKGGYRATFTKLFLEEHMADAETEMIVDNKTGEIIYTA